MRGSCPWRSRRVSPGARRRRASGTPGTRFRSISLVEQVARRRSNFPPSKRSAPSTRRGSSPSPRRSSRATSSGCHGPPVGQLRAVRAPTARPARARSPRWPRLPSGCRSARSRCRAASASRYWMPTSMFVRSPRSVTSPGAAPRAGPPPSPARRRACGRSGCGRASGRRRPPWRSPPGPDAPPRCRRGPSPTSRSLSCAHLLQRRLVGLRIVLDRDLRRHAAHGVDAAAVAGLDHQQRVGVA